ncbi:interferon-inducible GTPase 5-like [Crotalus adamanteus]|uniref:Interferon-inducible GTPase 5-like n=1 Tax=Crotalus adamanteus TaxID=8729 RepID=A0AAW1AXA3_CROAD
MGATRTCNSKAAEYLKKVQFERYDVFVLIVTDRFTENDAFLAKEIQRRRKKFYFVRSKIDISMEGERRKRNFNMEQTLETIRNYCEDTLKGAAELSARVFLDVESVTLPCQALPLSQEGPMLHKPGITLARSLQLLDQIVCQFA